MRSIGICFGCYTPLHQGHLDVIMRAKKENDITYVIVAGCDDDRGGNLLPLYKRYRLISNFLNDDVLKVLYVNDDDLGIDQSMSHENWVVWMKRCYYLISAEEYKLRQPVVGYTTPTSFNWYVSEKEYKKEIDAVNNALLKSSNQCILMNRDNPISGTKCREAPIAHWDKITTPFRPYFSHNILIAGTASEGKTTLCRDLGRYFNLPYSYEKGRDICSLKSDPEFTVKDFVYNIYEQRKYNEELICSPGNQGIFVSDTDNIVTLMYALAYCKRDDFSLSEDEYKLLYDLSKMYSKTTKWDKVFLLPPSKSPIVDDGERYMADSDYEIRKEFFDTLVNLYDDFGIEYEILDGGYYKNFCAVRDYINAVKGVLHE